MIKSYQGEEGKKYLAAAQSQQSKQTCRKVGLWGHMWEGGMYAVKTETSGDWWTADMEDFEYNVPFCSEEPKSYKSQEDTIP
jgi:hypothetical protein